VADGKPTGAAPSRLRRVGVWVLPLSAIGAIFWVVSEVSRPVQPGRTVSRCPERLKELKDSTQVNAVQASAANKTDPAATTLAAVDAQGKPVQGNTALRFTFGAERDVRIRRQTFRLPAGTSAGTVQAALINDFADTQNDRVLPAEDDQVQLGFQPTSAPGTVTLVVCIDPDGPGALHPGSYVGAAAVATSAGPSATLGMEVTAKDRRWWLVLAFAFAGGLAGIIVKLFADTRTVGDPTSLDLMAHIWTPRTLVALAAGITTAVYSYLTIYADDPTFAAEFGTLWRVAAETFAGTLAAKALTDLAGPAPDPGASRARRAADDGPRSGAATDEQAEPAPAPASASAPQPSAVVAGGPE
jgi:hypothetical protein